MMEASSTLETLMGSIEHAAAELARTVSSGTVIRRHEPMAKRTTLRVGGAADLYVEPGHEEDLASVLSFCREHRLPSLVLGRGSNLLVKDGGFHGVVICLSQLNFSRIEIFGNRLRCGAGARLKAVAIEAKRHQLAGLEFLEGIPGSVGGGLRMNAGAMGAATFEVVESVRLMDLDGNTMHRDLEELAVEYRSCATLKSQIALGAVLRGRPDSRAAIEERMNEFSRKRWQSQPAAPSAGCMFKNPATIPAGKLLDELGLKGTRIGGAMISQEHGNFIVNAGGAAAEDFLELIALAKGRAREERGIELQTEVEIIGD
jgi:UDP-N-acetylenolpyruvoylglucosamine reductase